MKLRHFFIGTLIVLVASVVFVLPTESLGLFIPSMMFAGMFGGIFIGYQRKRPLISCVYDGMLLGFPAGLLQACVVIPILWFYHNQSYGLTGGFRFVVLFGLLCIMICGLVGGPFGGLAIGLFYRYIKKDRGEGELYESYLDDKTKDSKNDLEK